MEEAKRKILEAKGWRVGTVSELLDLTPEERKLMEIKLALAQCPIYTKRSRAD